MRGKRVKELRRQALTELGLKDFSKFDRRSYLNEIKRSFKRAFRKMKKSWTRRNRA